MARRTIVLVVFALLFFVLPSTTTFLVDWLWFGEVGYRPIFVKALTTRAAIGLGVFALSFLWLAAHLRHALSASSGAPSSFTTREGFTIVLPTRDQLRPLALLAVAAASLLLALIASSEWLTLLQWWHQTPFPAADPILGYNAAFYIFTLPLLEIVRGMGLALVALAAIGSAAVYGLAGELALTPFGLRMAPSVRRHGAVLAAALFVVLALSAWLDQPRAMVTASGIIQGASYTDVHARMPAALALAAAAAIGVVLSLLRSVDRAPWALVAAAGLYAVVLLGGGLYAQFIQRVRRVPQRTGSRGAVYHAQHRRHAPGVRARPHRGTGVDR